MRTCDARQLPPKAQEDLRRKTVAAVRAGKSKAEAARLFGHRLAGVLLNAGPQHSLREAREEAAPALAGSGVPVLGIVPEDRMLLGFTVSEYSERLDGSVLYNG